LVEDIKSLNSILENSESQHSYSFIQLHDHFALEDGKMNMDYSTDGVHLNEAGYQVWKDLIQNKL
jgi:lysophospholipase L1-like esterase